MERAWNEIHLGAAMRIPKIYKFIIKYITPLFLLFILSFWFIQQGLPVILMKAVTPGNRIFVLSTRLGLLVIFLILAMSVRMAWRRKRLLEERMR
jgi:hypothetical protein